MIAELSKSNSNIRTMFGASAASQSSVAKMEIKLCSFIVEHNLPIHISDDLLALLSSLFPTNKTVQKATLGKQKATNVIRQVLGFHTLKESIADLKSRKFSLIIDETTDCSRKNQLAILVIFFNPCTFKMDCNLIDIIQLDDGKAETIYSAIVECFEQKDIPMENIVGFCADTCNVMFGSRHSVAQMLVANYPWIIPVKCACHMIHLCASHASVQLPKSIEDLCRNISSYFHLSPLRTKNFQEFQEFFDLEKHQLLKPGQTRWLSMKMCVDRIIEQYDALKLYFTGAAVEDPTHTNDSILKSLNNKFTLAYLEFMAFNLGRFTSFNTLFQSGIPVLYLLKSELKTLLTSILSDFMEVSYVRKNDPWHIDVNDQKHYVSLNKVYVGPCAIDTIRTIEDGIGKDHPDVQLFFTHCRNFQIESVKQILLRFDDCSKFDFLSFLTPVSAYSLSPPSLSQVYSQFPNLKDVADLRETDREWRQHALSPNLNGEKSFEEYWKVVFSEKNQGGEKVYPNLTNVVATALSLPFSNAAVERVFSQLRLIKNDHRATLKQESLLALLSTKYSFLKKGKRQAVLMDPSNEMLNLHKRMKSNADDEDAGKLRAEFLKELKNA
ncbi:uncharacterized protein LOC114524975 [Dendronephthya gigantea]|nr:uncharacterized protein LOC114524975 [Dendronephthya gigantea]